MKDESSRETRSRLEQIIEIADQEIGEYRDLYTALGTLHSKEQLSSLRALVPSEDRPVVDMRIEQIEIE